MMRFAVIAFLAVALMFPLLLILGLVSERSARRDAAVEEIGAVWGGPQTIGGPVLTVPYRCAATDASGRPVECLGRAHFLPETLSVTGTLVPEVRRRGLFPVVVYRAQLRISGRFARPDFSNLRPVPQDVIWSQAALTLGVTFPRGISRSVQVQLPGDAINFEPAAPSVRLFAAGLEAALLEAPSVAGDAPLDFSVALDVNGTRELRVLPAGRETVVELSSAWPHPSFSGGALPQSHESGESGFTARWSVPGFGRPYPDRWTHAEPSTDHLQTQAAAAAFGVTLHQPVDIYHQSERAVKYAILFIVTTFVLAFLWEITSGVPLHPVQYVFVGFAMCLFYLLLLSMSEHIGFDRAYGAGAIATTLLLGWYWSGVLRGAVRGAFMAATLASLYGFLYLLLRLEDYALLAGSVGLFLLLATVMYVTRRIDWYALSIGTRAADQVPSPHGLSESRNP
jgi:inner membrane protein